MSDGGPGEKKDEQKTVSRKGAKAQRKTQRRIQRHDFFFAPLRLCGRVFHCFSRPLETLSIGAGRGTRRTGFSSSNLSASCTARSNCGSRPLITSAAVYSTSISGATPMFSTSHPPV